MRVVVAYKWARDVDGAVVGDDGSVRWRSTKFAAGEDDPAAVTAALAIADGTGEVIGLTLGDGDASWALARGVPRAVSVIDAPGGNDAGRDDGGPEDTVTAQVLAAAVRSIGDVDVVVVGDGEEHGGVPVLLAGLLGWPALAGVTSAAAHDGRIELVRAGDDALETLSLAPPAVIAVAARGVESRVPGMKEQLAARRRPVTTTTLADLGGVPAGAVRRRGTHLPAAGAATIFDGDPVRAAGQLVTALRTEGVL